jgi:5-methylcytosine-specific restriction endonuclease McrA
MAEGINKKRHIDGFNPYWQNVRHRRFELASWTWERCGQEDLPLEAHHVTYVRFGFEEIEDLRALCRGCHEVQPRW